MIYFFSKTITDNNVIARICIFILLFIVLPDVYIYARYVRRRTGITLWQRLLWWAPTAILIAYTIALSLIPDFAPYELAWLNVYLFLLGLIAVPKLLFVFCSSVGLLLRRFLHIRRNWGNYVGVVLSLCALYILVYGSTAGVDKLHTRRVTLTFDNLPPAFDGYRIVQFSDVHVGSMTHEMMQRMVYAINRLKPDAVVFTGDLQNMQPHETDGFSQFLSQIKAKDGVFSVLGNHDYSVYVEATEARNRSNEALLQSRERSYGWQLLMNESRVVRRGADSIVIAGAENDGRPPFPSRIDMKRMLAGVTDTAFVVVLQHDPSSWRRTILPQSNAMLTLSGHTHGGQLSIFGFRPTQLTGREDCGIYREGDRVLNVSTGVGGFIPFRFGMPPEVVELTLRSASKAE